MIRVGCCGFPRRHAFCFEALDVVEVQATFYKPPEPVTLERWRHEAPEAFAFTLKAWQLITHEPSSPTYRRLGVDIPREEYVRYGAFRPTEEVWTAWGQTLQAAQVLRAEFLVFQCPASFAPTPVNVENLRRFFGAVEQPGLRFTWEPRGDWPQDVVAPLCGELNLIHCVDPFAQRPVTAGTAYFRLHGRKGYRYRYTDTDLGQLAELVAQFDEAWVLFNNISMWEDASRFRSLVRAS